MRAAALLSALLVSSCAWLGFGPDGDKELMLGGNDPVGYFTAGVALPGRPELWAEHDGVLYRFANDADRRLFITSPDRYVPQFGGLCANGMVYAVPTAGDVGAFKIIEGRLYLFGSRRAREYFEMDQERNLRLAWHYWEAEVRDSTRWVQSLKRQVFHVPHYKSNDDLAAEYARRAAGKPG